MQGGILIIDKEEGITSRDVVNKISKKFQIKKVGHTGTLDPIATGVLIVAVGEATKIIEFLTSDDKEYIARVRVGLLTDTLDITGNITHTDDKRIAKDEVEKVLNSFLGKYSQEVPKYSAVHVNGKRLYEYARSGEDVVLPKREVEIKKIELLELVDGEYQEFSFRVVVSKGTYIRSLIKDIGTRLDVFCTMSDLRRTKQGIFSINEAKKVNEISNDDFISITNALDNYPKLEITDKNTIFKIKNGAKLKREIDEVTCILTNNKLLAIYRPDNEEMRAVKVFNHDQ